MTDAELRGRLLEHFYRLRHNNGGWVPVDDMIFSEPVSREAIAGVCRQLADARLIEWKSLTGANEGHVIGMAIITGPGVDAVEQPAARAGATFCVGEKTGKFHGANAATGPTGNLWTT